MLVPRHWAEGRRQRRREGRQVTVRRFGWSNESPEAAQRHADERAAEALEIAWSDPKTPRSEPKVPYNGAEGVPIREEIVAEHGETVITRNSYGALCLNTPRVLFADIDYGPTLGELEGCLVGLIFGVLALVACVIAGYWLAGAVAFLLLWGCATAVSNWLGNRLVRLGGGHEAVAMRRIEQFVEQERGWQLRVYRTPAGLRVLAMNDTFDPASDLVKEFFSALGCDPLYAKMCRRQQCFRARVSPKPWRVGIEWHMKPRPGVWPINPERMPDRLAWVSQYEKSSEGYASCEYVTSLGSGPTHPEAREVQKLHDRLSRAAAGLPIA